MSRGGQGLCTDTMVAGWGGVACGWGAAEEAKKSSCPSTSPLTTQN